MSEIPSGSLSLEQPFDAQVEEEAPTLNPEPVAEAAPEAAPNPEDAEPEGTVEIPTGKVVPLSALQAERQAKKVERDARAALEAEIAQLRPKAQQAEAIAEAIAWKWQQIQPLLQQRLQQPQPPPPPPPAPAGPLSAQDAIEYAKDFDLYKTDGTPDVERAQRIAARHENWAEKKAQAAIAPYQQQTAATQSAGFFEQAAGLKDKTGQTVDRGILQQIWQQVPPEMSAKWEVATILYKLALAESVQQGKYRGVVTEAPPPVLHSEGLGGQMPGKPTLTSLDQRFVDASDIKTKDYTEIAGRYKPGQHNVLE